MGNLNPDMTELSDHNVIESNNSILAYEVPQHVLSEVDGYGENSKVCFDTTISKTISPVQTTKIIELESHERNVNDEPNSQEDSKILSVLKDGVHQLDNCHSEMPLPFESPEPELQSYKNLAIHSKNHIGFMHDIISKALVVFDPGVFEPPDLFSHKGSKEH